MTRKQMKKYAQEMYKCELIHQSETSTKEEKSQAENRIIQLTNQILALKDGMNLFLEIDEIIQQQLFKGEN